MEINNELIRSLGMALVHSLWEGLVILAVVIFALSLAGRSNARLRYLVLISGHFLLLASFAATWYIVYHHNIDSAIKPLTRMYTQVNGIVSTSTMALRTADYTSILKQFLEPLYPALAIGWTLGFICMVIRMAGGFYLSYNIVKKEIFLPDASLLALFEKAKSRLIMPGGLRLRMSSRQISPMVIGIIKPCVIVPAAILSGLNTEQVEAILVHELAHIRRYDHVVMILQAIITQIMFFHPVAWYLSSGIDRERENCCDDLVIKTFPNPINYIKALTMIQELNLDGQVPANALMGRSKLLLIRVRRLLKTEKRHAPVFRMAAIFLLLITLGIAAITIASAGNPGSKKTLEVLFAIKKDKAQSIADTTKVNKQGKVTADKDEADKDDLKNQKQLEEAGRKLEKAHEELEKAQLEMEKAREEFARAGGSIRSHDMADLSEDQAKQFIMEDRVREFRLRHEREFDERRNDMELQQRYMEGHFRRSQEDMRKMQQLRQEDWQLHMKEWENSGRNMKDAQREFFKAWKDSDKIWVHPPVMNIQPLPPASPDVPSPDINMEVPAPDINIPTPPEPVAPLEQIQEEQHQQELENTKPLDSQLKDLETD